MKKFFVLIAVVLVMAVGATVAFAATARTPAQIVSGLTGKTVDQVTAARQSGKTYGAQAAEAGKLQQFKDERLAQYKLALDEAVKAGRITQAEADKLYAAMKTRMASCTGNGTGAGCGTGCGIGNTARGAGKGQGKGQGSGVGRGQGRLGGGCGSCTAVN